MTAPETRERKPFIVHCRACSHEWPAFYTPLKLNAAGMRLMKSAAKACPMCASAKVFVGPKPEQDRTVEKGRDA